MRRSQYVPLTFTGNSGSSSLSISFVSIAAAVFSASSAGLREAPYFAELDAHNSTFVSLTVPMTRSLPFFLFSLSA